MAKSIITVKKKKSSHWTKKQDRYNEIIDPCKVVSKQTNFITDELFVDSAQSIDGSEGQHGDFGRLSMLQKDGDGVGQAGVAKGTEVHSPTLLLSAGLQATDQHLLHLLHNLPQHKLQVSDLWPVLNNSNDRFRSPTCHTNKDGLRLKVSHEQGQF